MEQEKKEGPQSGGLNITGGQTHVDGDMVGGDKFVYQPPAPVLGALHQLPPPPADFTGRAYELAELTKAVREGGAIISGIQGMGGVGKTALALKLAEQLTSRYPDAQMYLDLKGVSTSKGERAQPLAPKAALEHVIRTYRPDIKIPEEEAELAPLYRSLLHNQRAILLMDNALDAAQVEPLIPPPSCLFLVTSRQHFVLPGLVPKNLDALLPVDARALLVRIAPRLAQDPEDHGSVLAQLCGYLPQALRSVGSALAARADLRAADYVRKLQDARERLKLTATDASLSLSYDLLPADLQKRFRALAVFPDTFEVTAAAALWEAESEPAQEAIGQLLVYSLLEFNPSSGRYRLHDLVRLFADARLDPKDRAAAERRHARHYKEVAAAAKALYKRGGEAVIEGLALFDAEWGNIEAGQAWARARAGEDNEAAMLCSDYPDAGAYCLDLRQHPREQIRWREAALAAARRLHNRAAESVHLSNLGLAYHSLGDYRCAIEYHEKDLKIAREIGDRSGEGKTLGNLGIAYHSLGELRRAIEFHEQRLKIAQEIGDRRGEGNALGNLGLAYRSLGEYRRAIEYQEQSLKMAREIGDWRGEGDALGNLGNAYNSLGEYRRAVEYHEQHLKIVREIGDRSGEGIALFNMALVLDELRDRAQAISQAQAALKIFEQIEAPWVEKVRNKLDKWRR